MKNILLTLILLLSVSARADQCEWNSPSDAKSAVELIKLHNEIMFWCQNCYEEKPSAITQVESARAPKVNDEYNIGKGKPFRYVVVTVKGKEVGLDLAYTYIRTASDIFTNLSHLTGCPSEGATSFIQTTNNNKKIAHFYNAQGARQDVLTTTAASDINDFAKKARMPANKK